jgi:hypothetical protein
MPTKRPHTLTPHTPQQLHTWLHGSLPRLLQRRLQRQLPCRCCCGSVCQAAAPHMILKLTPDVAAAAAAAAVARVALAAAVSKLQQLKLRWQPAALHAQWLRKLMCTVTKLDHNLLLRVPCSLRHNNICLKWHCCQY